MDWRGYAPDASTYSGSDPMATSKGMIWTALFDQV
jgi:hypothetical protein